MADFYQTDPADPDAPVKLDQYDGPHGTIKPGDRVDYDNPQMPGLGSPSGQPMTVTALYDFGPIPASLGGGRMIEAILDGGAYEVTAAHLRPLPPEET